MQLGGQNKRRGQIYIHVMRRHTKGWSIFTSMQFGGQNKKKRTRGQFYIQIMGWNNKVWSILHPCNWEDVIEEEDKFTSV